MQRFGSNRPALTSAVTAFMALSLLVALPALAQQTTHPRPGPAGSWRMIGQTQASFGADHDTIVAKGPYDNFRKVKFKVTDAPLNLRHMVVTYDNGAPDRIEVRQNIPQGGESRAIDLRGAGKRSLRKIEFWYDTRGVLKGKANVTVFGQK